MYRPILVHLLISLFISSAFSAGYDGLVNKAVSRNIDLSSQLASHELSITVQNAGNLDTNEYILAIPSSQASHISYLEVTLKSGQVLKVDAPKAEEKSVLYKVNLASILESGKTVDLTVKMVLTHSLIPFPTAVGQHEKQLVRYYDNHFFYSPYKTSTQTTNVKLASSRIESKTEEGKTSVKGDTITYGPYADVKPFTVSQMALHFENTKPFITVSNLVKEIEISHWGNVAVEETYDVVHSGAQLKGTFSRYAYQRNPGTTYNVIPVLKQTLPLSATDVYYRDDIGNISTSHIFPSSSRNGQLFEITPRYPLFGGWKANFYTGYNLPLHEYVSYKYEDSSIYMLNISFGISMDDTVIDQMTVKIVLPEGASEIEVHAPFAVDSTSEETRFTYLDTTGRPVLVVKKANLVGDHNQYFQVTYRFSSTSLLKEPLLVVTAVFAFCLFTMLYVRLDLSIGPKRSRSAAEEKVEDLFLRLKDLLESRADLLTALEDAFNEAINSKNTASYENEKKRVEAAFIATAKDAVSVLTELEATDAAAHKKAADLEKKQRDLRVAQGNFHAASLALKLKKEGKPALVDKAENEYSRLDDEVKTGIDDLVENL